MADINETGLKAFVAGEALEQFRRVKLSSGTVVYADAYDDHIGFTEESVASGALVTVRLNTKEGTRRCCSAAAITSGARVYAAADGKVDDAYSGNGKSLGVALASVGSGGVVEFTPDNLSGVKMLYNAVAQSDAGGTSDASEFTFSNGSVVIPAGELLAGDILRIKAQGIHPSTNAADTFKGRLYVNTKKVVETPNPDAVNDDVFSIEVDITLREVSATGKLVAHGSCYNDGAAAGLATPVATAELAEDISGAVTIAIKGLWSASSGSNESRLRTFSVERIRR